MWQIGNGGILCRTTVFLHTLFQSNNLLIQHDKSFFYHHVLMVVSEKPVFEAAALSDFIEEVCQCVPLVQPAAEYVLDAAGTAVRDDVVYIPPSLVQRFSCGLVFFLVGQFLFPPGVVIDTEQFPCGIKLP